MCIRDRYSTGTGELRSAGGSAAVAPHPGPVAAGPRVAPAASSAACRVVEDPAAGLVGTPLQARRARAAQDRPEGAREFPLDPIDPHPANRSEVDDVAAVALGDEPCAHREPARDLVQRGELGLREGAPRGDGVGQVVQQLAQSVQAPPFRGGRPAQARESAVVEEGDEYCVLFVRNAVSYT